MSEEARNSSERDVLSDVFGAHYPRGNVFFAGELCGRSLHRGRDDQPAEQQGLLHVLQSGSVQVLIDGKPSHRLSRPGLILFGKPTRHEIDTPESGADVACANLHFPDPGPSPAMLGLPDCLVLPFEEVPGLDVLTDQLFAEARDQQPGQRTAVNLLVDLLLLRVLRHCQRHELVHSGILAAMGDHRIARVVGELHRVPEENWSVESQADIAGMSRASFAARFRELLGVSPGEFLQTIRLKRAQALLQNGWHLQSVANAVGYRSSTALARAFQQRYGISPRMVRHDPASVV